MIRLALLSLSLIAAPASAACPTGEKPVFSCATDNAKEISVCQGAAAITYRQSPKGGTPELTISEKNASFVWEHGEGVGAGIMDMLTFVKDGTTYWLTHTRNFDDPSQFDAHITIRHLGKQDGSMECSKIRFTPAAIRASSREPTEGVPQL